MIDRNVGSACPSHPDVESTGTPRCDCAARSPQVGHGSGAGVNRVEVAVGLKVFTDDDGRLLERWLARHPGGSASTTLGRRRAHRAGLPHRHHPRALCPRRRSAAPQGGGGASTFARTLSWTGPRRAGLAPAKATSARRPTRVRPRQAPPHPARPRLPTSAKTELLQLHSEDFRCWRGCGCFGPRRGDPALRDDQPAHPRHLPAGQNGVEGNQRPASTSPLLRKGHPSMAYFS
jgi:hypothetical protein